MGDTRGIRRQRHGTYRDGLCGLVDGTTGHGVDDAGADHDGRDDGGNEALTSPLTSSGFLDEKLFGLATVIDLNGTVGSGPLLELSDK